MAGSDKTESTVPAVTPTPPKNHATRDSDKSITSSSSSVDIASNDRHAGQRLLSSTYRNFHPDDMVDRFVAYLLKNEPTASALQKHVLIDHVKIARQIGGDSGRDFVDCALFSMQQWHGSDATTEDPDTGQNSRCVNISIKIDAYQLSCVDPVLCNLTLRYPDTLRQLLDDAMIEARHVLRRRMEVALQASLESMKSREADANVPDVSFKKEVNNMQQILGALRHSASNYNPRHLPARLVHLPPHSRFCKPTLSSISAKDMGTVVQISGTCVRVGPVRMMENIRTYRCLGKGCGAEFSVHANFGTANNALPPPVVCPGVANGEGGCGSSSFTILAAKVAHVDYQEIKVQESASALTRVGGAPRSLLVKLTDDLVDQCNPGDDVVVVGSLHAHWQGQGLGSDVEVLVGTCMEAHSVRVINADEDSYGGGGAGASTADLGLAAGDGDAAAAFMAGSGNLREKFRREFDALWAEGGLARRHPIATREIITRAVCPKMYGMHAVKLGLLLVLIGGAAVAGEGPSDATGERDGGKQGEQKNEESLIAQKEEAPLAFKIGDDSDDFDSNDDSIQQHKKKTGSGKQAKNSTNAIKSRRRIQSHILLIGDPGTGKSQFLRFAAALSPRSVLTTGTGSSTAGLTCAAVRDSGAGASGKEFSLEAGALALADRGVCCIDEFGCMSQQDRTSIHEAMEQQTISVAKAGIVCKLNARTSVVAVMNPKDGIYDAGQTLAVNSKLGSALLSRFDLVFVMLDQAVDVALDQAESRTRDANIAKFLLQQSIKHGSGYDRLLENETLTDDDAANGHWSLEKLRAYIATIRKNFQPELTHEASELLEKHYSLCRSQNDQSLVTVRFLESLIRLSQAHARLMYRGKVLLDDAVAVILLMECTPAALGGGMFAGPGSSPSDGYNDLNQNPIATEFRPFDKADAMFEDDKEKLLQRYRNTHDNGRHCKDQSWDQSWDNDGRCPAQHHAISEQSGQGGYDSRDHYGRQIMSQATSPHVQTRDNMMSPSEYIAPSSNCSVRHQYETRVSFHQKDLPESMHRSDNVHCSRFETGNHIQRYDASMSQNSIHQYSYPMPQQHDESCEAEDQFCHQDHACHNHAQSKNQIQGYTAASNQNERYRINDDGINVSPGYPSARPFQQNVSGTRHKKRRTAD